MELNRVPGNILPSLLSMLAAYSILDRPNQQNEGHHGTPPQQISQRSDSRHMGNVSPLIEGSGCENGTSGSRRLGRASLRATNRTYNYCGPGPIATESDAAILNSWSPTDITTVSS